MIGVIVPGARSSARRRAARTHRRHRDRRHGQGRRLSRAPSARTRPDVPIVQQACPLFVPLAEEGLIDGQIVEAGRASLSRSDARRAEAACAGARLHALSGAESDHRAKSRAGCALVDSAETTADAVATTARETRDLLRTARRRDRHTHFLATDAPDRFARVGEIFLGRPIDPERSN